MRDLAFIRTHGFGENERALYETLRLFFPEEAVVICADESKAIVETDGIPKVSITQEDAERLAGGALPPDWGWRMGDLCFARVREARPESGRYWLIEPDVYIPRASAAQVLQKMSEIDGDFLACGFRYNGPHPFNRGLKRIQAIFGYGCTFAFSRASGPAIDAAQDLRNLVTMELGANPRRVHIPNDEAVMANAVVENGLIGKDLLEVLPQHFKKEAFSFNPPHLRAYVERPDSDEPLVYHPVLSVDEIITRITAPSQAGYMPKYPRFRLRNVLPHVTSTEKLAIEAALEAAG